MTFSIVITYSSEHKMKILFNTKMSYIKYEFNCVSEISYIFINSTTQHTANRSRIEWVFDYVWFTHIPKIFFICSPFPPFRRFVAIMFMQ